MKPFPLPVIGPGSQSPDDDDLQVLAMPREMAAFSMPSVPEAASAEALRTACDALVAFHAADVDAAGLELGQRHIGEAVATDAADHGHLRAGARGGQRLVRALAAGAHHCRLAQHRLACSRQAGRRGNRAPAAAARAGAAAPGSRHRPG